MWVHRIPLPCLCCCNHRRRREVATVTEWLQSDPLNEELIECVCHTLLLSSRCGELENQL